MDFHWNPGSPSRFLQGLVQFFYSDTSLARRNWESNSKCFWRLKFLTVYGMEISCASYVLDKDLAFQTPNRGLARSKPRQCFRGTRLVFPPTPNRGLARPRPRQFLIGTRSVLITDLSILTASKTSGSQFLYRDLLPVSFSDTLLYKEEG